MSNQIQWDGIALHLHTSCANKAIWSMDKTEIHVAFVWQVNWIKFSWVCVCAVPREMKYVDNWIFHLNFKTRS